MALRRRKRKRSGALGRAVPSCNVRVLVGFGKGKPLPGSPLRRVLNIQQATAAVTAATGAYFPAYTVTPSAGVYFGEGEPSLAIDLFRTQFDRGGCGEIVAKAKCLAADLRDVLRQHSVLVVASDPSNRAAPLTADIVMRGERRSCPRATSRRVRKLALAAAKRTT